MQKNATGGNALFMILIAIFLLGALTVLIARTSGTSEDTGDTEQASIKASELVNYATSLQGAVSNLIQRGCGENELSFWTDTNNDGAENASDLYYNPTSPTNRSCHIFQTQGAGLRVKDLSRYITQTANTTAGWANIAATDRGAQVTGQIRFTGVGSATNTDLALIIPYAVRDICRQVNRILAAPMNGDNFYSDDFYYDQNKFKGPYTYYTGSIFADTATLFAGKKAGCAQNGGGSAYFYYVLLAR